MRADGYKSLGDQQLATIAKADRRAAEEVLLRVRPKLSRAIRIMIGNDRDYDDLLSQICLQVLVSIGNYKGTGTLEAWAGQMAFHIVAKHKKRRAMIEKVMVPDVYDRGVENSNPEQEMSRKHLRDRMQSTLQNIPEARRDSLVLRLVFGHSIEEISKLTGASVNTVRGRLRTGLRELRQEMVIERDSILAR